MKLTLEELESQIMKRMSGDVPGLAIAVVKSGEIRWMRGFGVADLATQSPATPQTVFLWFSMTKIATATAILQLADRGLLDIDDPVTRHYPEFALVRSPTDTGTVTIRHLLRHSSGLANPVPITWVHRADKPAPDPHSFLADLLAKHSKLKFAPGTRASYSNIGFLVLGQVIESVSGQSYQDYIRNRILKPLRMNHTDFAHQGEMISLAATGYQKRWSPITPLLRLMLPSGLFGEKVGRYMAFNPFYVNGAAYGGLVGPVEDAAQFLLMHLNGGEINGQRILSPKSTMAMQEIAVQGDKLDVGLGWLRPRSARRSGQRSVEHPGGGGGFFNVMRLYPDASLGIVMMGNATRYDYEAIVQSVTAVWQENGEA